MKIVDDAEKKVFIHIPDQHKMLTQQLQRRVNEDPNLRDRVVVGDERMAKNEDKNSLLSRDLILLDEAKSYENSGFVKYFASSQNVVLFSSDHDIQENHVLEGLNSIHGRKFGYHRLSFSLRATRKLVEFIAGISNIDDPNELELVILPPTVGVTIEGSDPDVIEVTTPWDEQQKFLVTTVKKLTGDFCH